MGNACDIIKSASDGSAGTFNISGFVAGSGKYRGRVTILGKVRRRSIRKGNGKPLEEGEAGLSAGVARRKGWAVNG